MVRSFAHTDGSQGHERSMDEASLPQSRLVGIAIGLAGLQFCWSVQIGYVTRTLLQLNLAPRFVSLAWLAGPIAGIVVQPVVGALSDACTSRLGRRRPYLIGGSLVTCFALCTFAYARDIGDALLVSPLVIAVASFWLLDFAINAAQGPLRALMADVAPQHQQQDGNAYFALMTGIGNFSGNMLGSVPLASILPGFEEDGQALYVIAVFVLAVTMGITVAVTEEIPLLPNPSSSSAHYASVSSGPASAGDHPLSLESPSNMNDQGTLGTMHDDDSWVAIVKNAPFPFRDTFIMQCFTWFAWFTIFIFATSWVGAEVYNGDASAAAGTVPRLLYDAGVRAGNRGLALQALVSSVFSLAIPAVVRRFSSMHVLFGTHVFLGFALTCTMFLYDISQGPVAEALIALTGLAWASTMTVPWALVSEAVMRDAPEKSGRYLTIFNLSQCFPEVIVSLVSTAVIARTGKQAAMLALGGAAAFCGAAYVLGKKIGSSDARPARAAGNRFNAELPHVLEIPKTEER